MNRKKRRELLYDLYTVLEHEFGPMQWWPAETPFEVCIGAILTQNAPWSGVIEAIKNLKNAGIFDSCAIADGDEGRIADAIRPSIYYNQKAKRLIRFCRFLNERFDGEIKNMSGCALNEARTILLSLSGIGYETADSMLLYALNKPVFVVDAYTRRILSRHGLVDPQCDYEELRAFFEDVFDPDPEFYNEFHALICHLGALRNVKENLYCGECPALKIVGNPNI